MGSTSDIIKFIKNGGDFKFLRNSGETTYSEIQRLINNIDLKDQANNEIKDRLKKIYDNPKRKQNLIYEFKSLFNRLSTRGKNGYRSMVFGYQDKMYAFIQLSIIGNIPFNSIRNIGSKANEELNMFKVDVIKLINKYSEEIDDIKDNTSHAHILLDDISKKELLRIDFEKMIFVIF